MIPRGLNDPLRLRNTVRESEDRLRQLREEEAPGRRRWEVSGKRWEKHGKHAGKMKKHMVKSCWTRRKPWDFSWRFNHV